MAIPNQADVRKTLTSERESKIDRCYARAMSDWMACEDKPKLSRWDRVRANMIFAYLANHLVEEFSSDPGARFIWEKETFKLTFDQKVVTRFKKANDNGVGSNIDTQAELGFCDPQMEIPGLPGLQKVEIDYTLNVTGTAICEVNVVARNGKKPLWSYPINNSGGAALVLFSRPKAPRPSPATVEKMVQPRTHKKDEKKHIEEGTKGS